MTTEEKVWIFDRYEFHRNKAKHGKPARQAHKSKAALLYTMIQQFNLVSDWVEYLAKNERQRKEQEA